MDLVHELGYQTEQNKSLKNARKNGHEHCNP
jgi:hypothetical protein